MRFPTTLVLGAGASKPYGFPTGFELRELIISLPNRQNTTIPGGILNRFGEVGLRGFCAEFEGSGLYSIDAFLTRRPELQEIGKHCIAALLLGSEAEWAIKDPKGAWYDTFWNQVAADRFEDLDFQWLSVVTFNYDRSFEQYLLRAIMATYGVALSEAVEKLKTLRIVHVYGSLGGALPGSSNYLDREGTFTADRVLKAATSLRVIPEHRAAGQNELELAQQHLSESWCTAIMGFGFDKTNLSRLNAGETLKPRPMHLDNHHGTRRVVATCMGMTSAEAMQAGALCGIDVQAAFSGKALPKDFFETDCVGLLRETLVLGG